MAGAKKNGMVGIMWVMTVLLVVLIAASLLASPATARDPFVGLSNIRGQPWKRTGASASSWLECCDNCQCEDLGRGPPCACYDRYELQIGCPNGCSSCVCDRRRYPPCSCEELLEFCPGSCGYGPPTAGNTAASSGTTPAGTAATGN
ncbi:hypothetical protein Taro_018346 [Colocasia esculenta]|uniref:Bowman-Birk serine protease inhibitors family domain-containing protein n=1 Tax=Colocasia esculenta TaxID=4460 RepID=A0A843UQI3_COLES|nr:hypothetical protein [Colocasia esculenta]